MLPPDLQRLEHILDYCNEIEKTIARYGNSFDVFDTDPDYQRSVSFSILQIGELSGKSSDEYRKKRKNKFHGDQSKVCETLLHTAMEA